MGGCLWINFQTSHFFEDGIPKTTSLEVAELNGPPAGHRNFSKLIQYMGSMLKWSARAMSEPGGTGLKVWGRKELFLLSCFPGIKAPSIAKESGREHCEHYWKK